MPVDPAGAASSDARDDASSGNGAATGRGAKVKAPRAGGPRRPPRPERGPIEPAGSGATPYGPGDAPGPLDPTRPSTFGTTTLAGDGFRPNVATPDLAPQPEPVLAAPVRTGRRRGRRVRRTVRRIDLWSVLKLSIVVYTCIYAAVLATIAALWALAYNGGLIDKLTSFLSDVGLENYHFYGDRMFKACAAIGAVAVLAGTVATVLATALVNVISEITGGIRFTVIEEDV